jgi:hypothetical protein
MLIDWEELFERDNTVFHCETEELANKLLLIAHDLGYTWNRGDSYIRNNEWYYHKENTYYRIKTGYFGHIECLGDELDICINTRELFLSYRRQPFKLKR